jgi:hypothetical protein
MERIEAAWEPPELDARKIPKPASWAAVNQQKESGSWKEGCGRAQSHSHRSCKPSNVYGNDASELAVRRSRKRFGHNRR